MPLPWESDFWGGKKGGLDIWDLATLGGSEVASQLVGGNNPLQNVQNIGSGIKGAFKDITGQSAAEAALSAADDQVEFGEKGLAEQKRQYDLSRADMAPWLKAGQEALGSLQGGINSGAYEMAPEEFDSSQYQMPNAPGQFSFSMQDFQKSPYYQFLQDEGSRGIERSAAARGGLASGNTLVGLQDRAQNIAAGEYGNQFNRALGGFGANLQKYGVDLGRAQNERNFGYGNFLGSYGRRADEKANQYNRLAGLAGTGQAQSQSLAGLGSNYGRDVASGYQGIGNALAAGQVGAANAKTNFWNNAMNLGSKAFGAYMGGK